MSPTEAFKINYEKTVYSNLADKGKKRKTQFQLVGIVRTADNKKHSQNEIRQDEAAKYI